MDGSSPSLGQLEQPAQKLSTHNSKAGICLWTGSKCNTGGEVGGVFMGCDSSKMITRCAKLTGAQCKGDSGETYRCYWNVNNDRTSSVRSDINHGHAEQASMNLDMGSTVVSVAQWNLSAID